MSIALAVAAATGVLFVGWVVLTRPDGSDARDAERPDPDRP